jgi:hypothetical protein
MSSSGFFSVVRRRAWADTVAFVGPHKVVYTVTVTALGAAIAALDFGVATTAVWWKIGAAAISANIVGFAVVWLVQIVAAPKRIYDEQVIAMRDMRSALEAERIRQREKREVVTHLRYIYTREAEEQGVPLRPEMYTSLVPLPKEWAEKKLVELRNTFRADVYIE